MNCSYRARPARGSLTQRTWFALFCTPLCLLFVAGCGDDIDAVREIQAQRQQRMQSETQEDHLGEVFGLLNRLVELNPEQAQRQITYHLNRWQEDKTFDPTEVTSLVANISDVLPTDRAEQWIGRESFVASDVNHLRDAYLFRRIVDWADDERSDDPLLTDWLAKMDRELPEEQSTKLRTAVRLFDWTVRNIAFEPLEPKASLPPHPPLRPDMVIPEFSLGMKFQGPGYRQTDYMTVWRGIGDSLQRAGVFTQLCRQASIPAFVLAIQSDEDGSLDPWSVGVLIGEEIYLFEPELGIYVPGPGQVGIATLAQARRDASVMRRLNVVSYFDYPLGKDDIQQCIALLNVMPEAISPRMKNLESGLAGDRRMKVYVDADALAKRIDAVPGIAGVRLWKTPLLAAVYEQELDTAAMRDPQLGFWKMSAWAIMDAPVDMSKELALARWRHLHGQFDNDEREDTKGARVLYLSQRAPEFEIEDLRIDVDLQQAYGVRRDLGVDPQVYELQLRHTQDMMRMGKNTATYWISLIQYDDARYETAETWLSKRVLSEDLVTQRELTGDALSPWPSAARYNLARSLEQTGETDQAIELYKTDGDPQEHGNRLRARLLDKARSSE